MTLFGRSSAPVPTQSFSSANFVGTPIPQVGQVGITPSAMNVSGGTRKTHIAATVAVIIVLAYIAHHYFFE